MLWFILFFAPAAFGATEWWSRAVIESLIFILAAMCALRRDFFAPLNGPLTGFGAIIGLGVLQLAGARPLTDPAGLSPFTVSRPQTLYALLLWTALAALFWSASGILRWEGALRRASWAIFGIGLFIAVVGILQRGQGNTAYYGLRSIPPGRNPFGPFTNYDHAATWMVCSAFVGFGLLSGGLQSRRVQLSERLAQQVMIAFLIAVLVGAILETGSRGGVSALSISALATSFIAAGALADIRARRLVRAGLALAGIAYCAFLYSNPKWRGVENGALDLSASYRLSMYRSGLRLFQDFPLFGAGLGAFGSAFQPYQEAFVVGRVDHLHSSWFEIAVETGMLGSAAFGLVAFLPLSSLGRRLSGSRFQSRAAAAGVFAALLAFAVQGFIEFSFQIPADAILLVVLSSAAAALVFSSAGSVPVARPIPRAAVVGAFLVLALGSLPFGIDGASLRLGAPFSFASETLLSAVEPANGDLIQERDRLFRNPVDPSMRYRYGAALWKAGRTKDAESYLQYPGDKK